MKTRKMISFENVREIKIRMRGAFLPKESIDNVMIEDIVKDEDVYYITQEQDKINMRQDFNNFCHDFNKAKEAAIDKFELSFE